LHIGICSNSVSFSFAKPGIPSLIDVHSTQLPDEQHLRPRQNAVGAGGAVGGGGAVAVSNTAKTSYTILSTLAGGVVQTKISVLSWQTTAPTGVVYAQPATGSVGLGTLTGTIGVVKTATAGANRIGPSLDSRGYGGSAWVLKMCIAGLAAVFGGFLFI
jgi:hypothetical protein